MAANFYLSSHANHHLHPRSAILAARADDLNYATEEELGWVEIWSGTLIQKLCRRLSLRQQVSATAIVFFRRFYLRNSYCDTDVPLVAAACCYVAAKAEETPVHVKSAVGEAREVLADMGHKTFPLDNTKLAEMEFYLIEELDFHLIIYHPYRSLVQLTGRDGARVNPQTIAAGGKDPNAERRKAMLKMDDTSLQMAWFVINDSYRSSLPLVHPPHLIALAAIYMGLALHPPPSLTPVLNPSTPEYGSALDLTTSTNSDDPPPSARTRRQSLTVEHSLPPKPSSSLPGVTPSIPPPPNLIGGHTEPLDFLSALNVDHSLIFEIIQEILALYELWHALENATGASGGGAGPDERVVAILERMRVAKEKDVVEKERAAAMPGGNAAQGSSAKKSKK